MKPQMTLVLALGLALVGGGGANAETETRAGGTAVSSPLPAIPDTTMLTGSGLNTTGGPIDRVDRGGVWRKERGSRSWFFVPNMPTSDGRAGYERHLQELIRLHGNEFRDIVIAVEDTGDVATLRPFEITVEQSLPCTLAVRVLYRQLPEMKKAKLLFWDARDRRPARKEEQSPQGPVRRAQPTLRGVRPAGAQGSTAPGGASSYCPQTVPFNDGFEVCGAPSDSWDVWYYGSVSWGDQSSSCAYVHTGSWSLSADGAGGPCFGYSNDEDTWVENPTYFDMSNYSQYTVSYWVYYSIEASYDYFNWYYDTGGGWQQNGHYSGPSGGWVQKTLVFPNSSHLYDRVKMKFEFISDYTNTDLGVYIDDITITGTQFQPNLTSCTPSGWSGPIVPSSTTGTYTTGNLYADQPTYIDWAIQDNNSGAAGPFSVYYYLDDVYVGSHYYSSGLAGNTYAYDSDWPLTVATAGNHTLKMVIDATGSVAESNEGDNTFQQTFYWNPPQPPDLVVQSIVPGSTTPAVGSTISATVTIKNQGTGTATGTFWTFFYKNLGSAPSQGQGGYDDDHATFSLAPGASENYTVTGLTSQFAIPWHMYAYADATNAITNESSEGNNSCGPITVNWHASTVTVSGALAFDDTSYTSATRVNDRPARYCKVELWDSDAGQGDGVDELLATTITDGAGQFAFPAVPNDDEVDHGPQDVYVKAYLRSEEAELGTAAVRLVDATGTAWTFRSGTYNDIATGAVPLGTIKPLDYGTRSALNIYDVLLHGYQWSVAQGGTPSGPWYVKAQWQQGIERRTMYSYQDTTILIAGALSTTAGDLLPNEWDDDAIWHEYAHHLAHVFGFDDPSVGGTHSPQTQATCGGGPCPPLAWAEGCSHFLSCLMASPVSGVHWNTEATQGWTSTHDFEIDLETGIVTYGGLCLVVANDQGATWETPVAGTLWDLYDSRIDNQNMDSCFDTRRDTLARIWDVLTNHPGESLAHIGDFYRMYCQRYEASMVTRRALYWLFCEHGMDTVGCALVDVDEGGAGHLLALSCAPNPFHGRAWVTFDVPGEGVGRVRLGVYDVAGRLVRDLLDGELDGGRHSVVWDAVNRQGEAVRPGLYFCRLQTRVGTRTASVLVLR